MGHDRTRDPARADGALPAVETGVFPTRHSNLPERIVSGGQSGADRAALDVALELGLATGGWCPQGRRAEDGPIDERYDLVETPSPDYLERTDWNVRDSDGTLIVARRPLSGGTAVTERFARRRRKPCLVVHPDDPDAVDATREWLRLHGIAVLNVAGPRESSGVDSYDATKRLLEAVLGGG